MLPVLFWCETWSIKLKDEQYAEGVRECAKEI
jgi:hypothetical protein